MQFVLIALILQADQRFALFVQMVQQLLAMDRVLSQIVTLVLQGKGHPLFTMIERANLAKGIHTPLEENLRVLYVILRNIR